MCAFSALFMVGFNLEIAFRVYHRAGHGSLTIIHTLNHLPWNLHTDAVAAPKNSLITILDFSLYSMHLLFGLNQLILELKILRDDSLILSFVFIECSKY